MAQHSNRHAYASLVFGARSLLTNLTTWVNMTKTAVAAYVAKMNGSCGKLQAITDGFRVPEWSTCGSRSSA
ncbi:hypothetical protein P3T76_012456 [Phytophthora citrophthora]|uniref:Uncharacterized protein n=1 Tax=Phytophthora citrophthora TaxID=4793 RepID=A0AAD9LD56_9STRA|nr:hypothetical protein P3T76_012456 [Phytophthora citrophthora]